MVAQTVKHNRFFDSSFHTDRTGYYILTVQFNDYSVAYTLFEPGKNQFIAFESFSFPAENNPVNFTDTLNDLKNKVEWINKPFKAVNIVIENSISTIIPKALFAAGEAETVLRFCQDLPQGYETIYETMKNTGAINIYGIPKTMINECDSLWPGARMFHFSSVLIESLSNSFKNKTDNKTLFVHLRQSAFDVVYFNKGKLHFYNLFDYRTKEDFIYFLLAAAEQLQLNPEELQLILCGAIEKDSDNYDMAFKYIQHLAFIGRNETYAYSSALDELNCARHYGLFNAIECES